MIRISFRTTMNMKIVTINYLYRHTKSLGNKIYTKEKSACLELCSVPCSIVVAFFEQNT